MPGRPVTEVVQQAAEALNKGNYRLAVETCQRVLGQFPEFARAYLLLAEAQLEQGDLPAAERAFQETLRREPQSAAAYAGLGKIAEQRGDQEAAIAYLQAAWENAPRDEALRDRVSRLSERLYGPGGRLHLTRAGLATLHAESGRWSRAATEAAAVLEEHPTRLDARLRLAESLWRRGRDDEAATAAQAVLDAEPLAVRALLILADIERRRGRQEQATALVERAHAIDLDGVLAADLISVADDAGAFLRPKSTPMLTEEATAPERPRIAPAPDFMMPASRPRRAEQPVPTPSTPPPAAAAGLGSAAPAQNGSVNGHANGPTGAPFELGLMSQEEVEAARPSVKAFEAFDEVFRSIEGAGVEPFSFGETPGAAATPPRAAGPSASPGQVAPPSQPNQPAAQPKPAPEPIDDISQLFSLASDEDILAARPPEERPAGYTTLLSSLDSEGLQPFAVGEPGAPAAPSPAPAPQPSQPAAQAPAPPAAPTAPESDFVTDLTTGWEMVDEEIERAIPSGSTRGYTDELRRLDETGLEPFSVEGVPGEAEPDWLKGFDLASPAPPPSAPPVAPAAPHAASDTPASPRISAHTQPEPTAAEEPDLDQLFEWQAVDAEIQRAIPGEEPRGLTMEFEDLAAEGLEPFSFGAPERAAEAPELTPEPEPEQTSGLVSEQDLLAITEELSSEPPAPEPAPQAAVPEEAAALQASPEVPVRGEAAASAHAAAQPEQSWHSMPEPRSLAQAQPEPAPAAQPFVQAVERGASALRASIERLGVDEALFERARAAKAQLVGLAQITGNKRFPGSEPAGPSREDLEQAVAADPEDATARRQLAGALAAAGEGRRALEQYRWLYHHRQANVEIVPELERLSQSGELVAAGAQRLIGAIYRRDGQFTESALHYQLALELQLQAGKRKDRER